MFPGVGRSTKDRPIKRTDKRKGRLKNFPSFIENIAENFKKNSSIFAIFKQFYAYFYIFVEASRSSGRAGSHSSQSGKRSDYSKGVAQPNTLRRLSEALTFSEVHIRISRA